MFDETEVPTEYYETPTVPIEAAATGKIGWWHYEARQKEGNDIKTIYEGETICVIDVKTDNYLKPMRPERVYTPSKGYIEKIIKKVGEDVTKGETIAEWKTLPVVPPGILDRYGISSIG